MKDVKHYSGRRKWWPHYWYPCNKQQNELRTRWLLKCNKKEHKEIPGTTEECEDEQLSTHGGGGNPNFVILTYELVEDMVLYIPKSVTVLHYVCSKFSKRPTSTWQLNLALFGMECGIVHTVGLLKRLEASGMHSITTSVVYTSISVMLFTCFRAWKSTGVRSVNSTGKFYTPLRPRPNHLMLLSIQNLSRIPTEFGSVPSNR
jgi:hypothetical protein